jgi:hypothetical protein
MPFCISFKRPLQNLVFCVMSKLEEVRNRSLLAISEDCAKGMPSARTDENEDIMQKNGSAKVSLM